MLITNLTDLQVVVEADEEQKSSGRPNSDAQLCSSQPLKHSRRRHLSRSPGRVAAFPLLCSSLSPTPPSTEAAARTQLQIVYRGLEFLSQLFRRSTASEDSTIWRRNCSGHGRPLLGMVSSLRNQEVDGPNRLGQLQVSPCSCGRAHHLCILKDQMSRHMGPVVSTDTGEAGSEELFPSCWSGARPLRPLHCCRNEYLAGLTPRALRREDCQ